MEFDLPAARGMRLLVATFANERGDVAEMTDVSTNESQCVLQEPTQIGLKPGGPPGLLRTGAVTG
jgi:hypothetical protein